MLEAPFRQLSFPFQAPPAVWPGWPFGYRLAALQVVVPVGNVPAPPPLAPRRSGGSLGAPRRPPSSGPLTRLLPCLVGAPLSAVSRAVPGSSPLSIRRLALPALMSVQPCSRHWTPVARLRSGGRTRRLAAGLVAEEAGVTELVAARTIEELRELAPTGDLLAGGTDLLVQIQQGRRELGS